MSKNMEFEEERQRIKLENLEDEVFYNVLGAIDEREGSIDHKIKTYVAMRKSTIDILESDHRWLYTRKGFINRSDFVTIGQDISFTTNLIRKNDIGFSVDSQSTLKAQEYYQKNCNTLILLTKIERVLHSFYLEHQEEVDNIMNQYKKNRGHIRMDENIRKHLSFPKPKTPQACYSQAYNDATFTRNTIRDYGYKMLLAFSNLISQVDKVDDLEELERSYIEAFRPLIAIRSNEENQFANNVDSLTDFPDKLMRLVGLYSIRGEQLQKLYNRDATKIREEAMLEEAAKKGK